MAKAKFPGKQIKSLYHGYGDVLDKDWLHFNSEGDAAFGATETKIYRLVQPMNLARNHFA